ncbi:MAG: hypothetical protein HRT35_35990 [Algicola sp.]|nr:hypothetical protein [Algicola sp.]
MKHNFAMPTNNDEFLVMLKTLKVKNPSTWVRGTFSRHNVVVFLLLWDMWSLIPNPSKAEQQLRNSIDRAMFHRENNPKHDIRSSQDESIDITQKWLDQGIDAEEIVTVKRESQIEAIYGFLQLIEQADEFNHGITRHYGVFEVDLDENYEPSVAPGSVQLEDDLTGKMQSAMPEDQPDMPRWC